MRLPESEIRHTTSAQPTRMIRFQVRTRRRPTDRPSRIHSGRSFFFIAPEMRCLDIARVVIPPRASHSFRIPVVRHDIVVICELFMTDRAFPVLLDNLPVQQFPHFSRRPEFPISPRMMRILNASNPRPQSARIGRLFPAAAGNRFVDWAVLIATKPHDISPNGTRRNQSLVCGDQDGGNREGGSLRWAATMPVRGGL